MVVTPGRDVEHLVRPEAEDWLVVASKRVEGGGWTIELVVHWREVGRSIPLPGDVIGLDVVVRDEDDDGARASIWSLGRCDRDRAAGLPLFVLAPEGEAPRLDPCDQTCPSGLCAPAGYPCAPALACAP